MGACIYTSGMKAAYIPINHTDIYGQRLEWQLTEQDLKQEFDKLCNTNIIMHNAKFDIEVIRCTCNCNLSAYWDTLIGAKVLDENERAGLKEQYITKIDSSIEKYDITHLFDIEYAVVDPEIFALYAATDSFMTFKLFEYQKKLFEKPENKRLYSLFMNIEMPVIEVVVDMELTGVCLDLEYAKRLSKKYHDKYDELQKVIAKELSKYETQVAQWRLTSEANYKPKNKTGTGESKSKSEQLENPVNLASPIQLAIFLYDVLKIKPVSVKAPRGTGEEILQKIDLPICKLILEQRGLLKLINTYIDKLPSCLSIRDNRLHASFNQYGADTGRFSSSEPNLQNIPSSEHSIRMMFTSSVENDIINFENDVIRIYEKYDIETPQGYVQASDLQVGDALIIDTELGESQHQKIKKIQKLDDNYVWIYL